MTDVQAQRAEWKQAVTVFTKAAARLLVAGDALADTALLLEARALDAEARLTDLERERP